MYADFTEYIMIADVIAILFFVSYNLMTGKRRLIHWLYAAMVLSLALWQCAIIAMKHVDPDSERSLFLCDAVSNIGVAFAPVATLLLALVFTQGWQRLPKRYVPLLLFPLVTVVLVFTNPMHHLYYEVFSVYPERIVFGPYMYVSGTFSYLCLITALFNTLRFALKVRQRIFIKQSVFFAASILVPAVVSMLATFQILRLSIAATPLAFVVSVICQGVAIYYLGFLNIEPLALERVLDNISDGFIVLGGDLSVVSYNKQFAKMFTPLYDIRVGTNMGALAAKFTSEYRGIIYNLLTSVESANETRGVISYEQAVLTDQGMNYYAVEVTPLVVDEEVCGYIAMLKDVTRLREMMRREQDDLSRSMERERLASLGQMIGGIAHNLKTPIMSISGSTSVLNKLAGEYNKSIGDAEVTLSDHQEIYGEMMEWLGRIQTCCAYMSDIITTVKGLATNMSTSEVDEFTVDEMHKRVFLLMQHELKRGNCTLVFENSMPEGTKIHGDINNLVQVVNNLISNAVDAMQDTGGDITLSADKQGQAIVLRVADQGPGVPPEARAKLFREMYTSKGAKGTGLGLYISNVLMHGKFGGRLWLEESQRGAVFCLSIPLQETEAQEPAKMSQVAQDIGKGGFVNEKE